MTRKEEIVNYANSFKAKGMEIEELKEVIRLAIIDGATWADKTMLVKATEWLSANLHRYDESIGLGVKEFVERFKKEMEE